MDNKNQTGPNTRKRRSRSPLPFILGFILLLVILILFYIFFQYGQTIDHSQKDDSLQHNTSEYSDLSETSKEIVKTDDGDDSQKDKVVKDQLIDRKFPLIKEDKKTAEKQKQISFEQNEQSIPQEVKRNNDDKPKDLCRESVDIVRDFFIKLDAAKYIESYKLEQNSEPYFLHLINKLAKNPPVVSRETDDLFTILQNTAHFFRIIGSKNITLLKSILDQEKDQFETVLLHFYELTRHKDCLKKNFNITLSDEALYEYAGFFLNTMGGRLYLFRRDSVSRLAVSFYSILIIDNANSSGKNHHGLEIKQPVTLLISEIENSQQLILKDFYLEKLYEIENRLP